MTEIDREVVDARDAARIVGLSRATLATLRSKGDGPPYIRINRAIRYRVKDLRDWRDSNLVSTAEQGKEERR